MGVRLLKKDQRAFIAGSALSLYRWITVQQQIDDDEDHTFYGPEDDDEDEGDLWLSTAEVPGPSPAPSPEDYPAATYYEISYISWREPENFEPFWTAVSEFAELGRSDLTNLLFLREGIINDYHMLNGMILQGDYTLKKRSVEKMDVINSILSDKPPITYEKPMPHLDIHPESMGVLLHNPQLVPKELSTLPLLLSEYQDALSYGDDDLPEIHQDLTDYMAGVAFSVDYLDLAGMYLSELFLRAQKPSNGAILLDPRLTFRDYATLYSFMRNMEATDGMESQRLVNPGASFLVGNLLLNDAYRAFHNGFWKSYPDAALSLHHGNPGQHALGRVMAHAVERYHSKLLLGMEEEIEKESKSP